MVATCLVNTKNLLRKARASESREAFNVLKRGRGCRIGVGARVSESGRPAFFIEAVVSLAPPSPAVDMRVLESRLEILKRLAEMGYGMTYQDDLGILCEAEFPESAIGPECESLLAVLAKM